MAIPTPSFFKIRLKLIIMIALVFVFLVGLAKQVFSAYSGRIINGECYALAYRILDLDATTTSSYRRTIIDHPTNGFALQTNGISPSPNYHMVQWRYKVQKWAGTYWGSVDGGNWGAGYANTIEADRAAHEAYLASYGFDNQSLAAQEPSSYWPNGPPEDCGVPCYFEHQQLEQQCGEGGYYIDEDTCAGDCKCNDNDEDGICNACDLDPNDPEVTNVAWIWHEQYEPDGSLCDMSYVLKKSQCDQLGSTTYYQSSNPGGCSGASVSKINMPCISYEINGNCTPDNCNVCDEADDWLSALIDGATTGLNPNTPQPDTDEKTDECQRKCFPKAFMYVPGSDSCICVNDSNQTANDPNPSEGAPKPTEEPPPPDTSAPNQSPGSGATDNELLQSVDENARSTVQNTQAIAQSQTEMNQTLNWMGENAKATADNTAKIENSIDSMAGTVDSSSKDLGKQIGEDLGELGDDITSDLDDLGNKLGDLQDAIEGQGEPGEDLSYTVPDQYSVTEHSWSDRTTQFLTDMQDTGLFAVPGEFFGSIPSGGSPDFIIEGGQTFGSHTLSFADFSGALVALRAVIQVAFMWLAIRIVTLKR